MPADRERHQTLAGALPVRGGGPVVDLGCGHGLTLRALREHLGPEVELVGVDKEHPALDESLAADANVRGVAADLRQPLPFSDGCFEAAVCHNTLECLTDKQAFLREVARILRPGAHLLLSHTDFDTIVFNASDLELTRRLIHANADTQEKWMDDSDGTIGRKLVGIGRHSPLELVGTLAWVALDTSFAEGGAAHSAVRSIAASVRPEHHDDLAARLDEWIGDLHALAGRGEFLFSVNDYAVLLRAQRRHCTSSTGAGLSTSFRRLLVRSCICRRLSPKGRGREAVGPAAPRLGPAGVTSIGGAHRSGRHPRPIHCHRPGGP